MRAPIALIALLAAGPGVAGSGHRPAPSQTLPGNPALHRVNIVGSRADGTPDDRRGPLQALAPALGLDPAEVTRLRASTGLVLCDEDRDGMRPIASAVLVGDGTRIVTAAHVLRDPVKDWAPLPAGTACLFRNQAASPETVPLRLDGTQVLGTGGRDDLWDPNDYAVVRLVHPLADPAARPFPLAAAPDRPGAPVILISGFQADLRPSLGLSGPIAQEAHVERAGQADGFAPRPIYLVGAMDAGGSGGAMLVRDGGGLALAGIVSSTGAISRNGFAFSLQMMSFVRAIAIEGSFRKAVEEHAVSETGPAGPALCRRRIC